MFRHYLKISLRSLFRSKMISSINIIGLAVAIACCLLISLYVIQETSYDKFHKNADRIVRVTMEYSFDGTVNKVSVTGTKVFPALKRDLPEVENGVRLYPSTAVVNYHNKIFNEKSFVYADSTFFELFSFKLIKGNPINVLNRPNTVVLTESMAKKYFGDEEPVGKILRVNNKKDLLVTGIAADAPANSQIKFDFLASFYTLPEDIYKEENWWDASYYTYLLLESPEAIESLAAKIPAYMKAQEVNKGSNASRYMTLHTEPLEKVHLHSKVEGGLEPGGDYRYIYIFSIIAILVLAIACFNYINLTTARAAERAKEVGVRKAIGAFRRQLVRQFLGESVIVVTIALVLGIVLVYFLLPTFNLLAGKKLSFLSLFQPMTLFILLAIVLIIGFLGGSYPALILSKFNPIKVLKGNFTTSNSGVWLRKGLISLQFFISIGLIIGTIIIRSQLSYIQNKKLGYNKDHVIILPSDEFIQQKLNAIESEFLSNQHVKSITTCNQLPTFVPGKYNLTLDKRDMIVGAIRTNKNFLRTMDLKLISGADFTHTDQIMTDSSGDNLRQPLVVNESAIKLLGWSNDEAIGKPILFQGRNCFIKGVVEDFHFNSMHEAIGPFVIFLTNTSRHILVKLSGNQIPQTLDFLKSKWKNLVAHRPWEYRFLDEEFNKLYASETRTGKLFYLFSILAIGLACSGLFGMVAFIAQQKTKEIGIRKVLGASPGNIVYLLSKSFLAMVLIASLVVFPAVWWAMNKWLQGFAYRISIEWWMFAAAGLGALLIAFLTVSVHALKAALANPVKNLRTE